MGSTASRSARDFGAYASMGPAGGQLGSAGSCRRRRAGSPFVPMMGRLSSEYGQGSVEWGGVLMLVSLVIGVLVSTGVATSVARGMACEAQKALSAGGCSASLTPAARPTPPRRTSHSHSYPLARRTTPSGASPDWIGWRCSVPTPTLAQERWAMGNGKCWLVWPAATPCDRKALCAQPEVASRLTSMPERGDRGRAPVTRSTAAPRGYGG